MVTFLLHSAQLRTFAAYTGKNPKLSQGAPYTSDFFLNYHSSELILQPLLRVNSAKLQIRGKRKLKFKEESKDYFFQRGEEGRTISRGRGI